MNVPLLRTIPIGLVALAGLVACGGGNDPSYVVGFDAAGEVVIFAHDPDALEVDSEVPTIFSRDDLDTEAIARVDERPEFNSRVDSDSFVVSLGD
jgi:hypothetical protein